MVNKRLKKLFQIEGIRAAVKECDIIDAERSLHLTHLIEFIQYNVCICIALELNNDSHTFEVGLVVNIGNSVNLLFGNEFGNVFD